VFNNLKPGKENSEFVNVMASSKKEQSL